MEITKEKKEFYTANKATIQKMVDRANLRRNAAGADEVSGEEFDEAISAMMEMKASGQPIVKYRFPMPQVQPAQDADEPQPAPSKESPTEGADTLILHLVPAKNGYLGKLLGNDKKQELFIFKNADEFRDIISPILWPK